MSRTLHDDIIKKLLKRPLFTENKENNSKIKKTFHIKNTNNIFKERHFSNYESLV